MQQNSKQKIAAPPIFSIFLCYEIQEKKNICSMLIAYTM